MGSDIVRGSPTRRQVLASTAMLGISIPGAQAAEKLTFITGFGYVMGFIEVMYGAASGIFQRHGLDLEVQGGNGTAMAVQQLLSGNAQIARAGSIDVIRAVADALEADPQLLERVREKSRS